jgi:hypothetical protein
MALTLSPTSPTLPTPPLAGPSEKKLSLAGDFRRSGEWHSSRSPTRQLPLPPVEEDVSLKRPGVGPRHDRPQHRPSSSIDRTDVESRRRSRRLSSLVPRTSSQVVLDGFNLPTILARILFYLPLEDFLTVSTTCRNLRNLIAQATLEDLILSQYVPGYRFALQHKEMDRYRDVPITMYDLRLLCKCIYEQKL